LFIDLEGRQRQLQDIIDEGLDGGYEYRLPELADLLGSGEPYHRLLACVMLVSWGQIVGFQQLIDWATHQENIPWQGNSVVYERISGSDSAFEMLADALMTSYYCDTERILSQFQINSIKSLLNIYHKYYFSRALALAISRRKETALHVKQEIISALKSSIERLKENSPLSFDLAFQSACLLTSLAPIDDPLTACFASQLACLFPHDKRVLRELINALKISGESDTLEVLQCVKELDISGLNKSIELALFKHLNLEISSTED
jgi:hypothetical protein